MQLNVRSNIREFTAGMTDIQRRQIPYALSRALNDTAVSVQSAEVENVQRVFKNKKNWWNRNNRNTGIRVEFSSKKKLTASVYTNAHFAQMQEDGGTKLPRKRYIAIPTNQAPKNIQKSGGVAKALSNPRSFISSYNGETNAAVYQRKGKKTYPLKVLFVLTPKAEVKPAMHYMDTAMNRAKRDFNGYFAERLSVALATAKR